MMKTRTRKALALTASAVALSFALSGCSALNGIINGGDAQRDDDGQVTEDSNIDIFSLKLGDCLPADSMSGGETSDTDVVPCSDPHGYEVYFEFDLADGEFPGSDAIQTEVEAQCVPEFETFAGIAYQESVLDITWYEPTQASWDEANDRKVQCLILEPSEDGQSVVEVSGTLKGAAR